MSESATHSTASLRGDDWRDRLVELHVLADHGDHEAAATAAAWLARDEHARQVWAAVQRTCDDIRHGAAGDVGRGHAGVDADGRR
jgi:hypothetical protein